MMKTVSKGKSIEKATFWKHPACNVDSGKRSLLNTVAKKASYTVAFISVFGRFSVDDVQKRSKVCVFEWKRIKKVDLRERWRRDNKVISDFQFLGLTVGSLSA